jgi:hypothetical protein
MSRFGNWWLAGCLVFLAAPSLGASVDAEYIFSVHRGSATGGSYFVGIEMDGSNRTTSLVLGDRVHIFNKMATLIEFPHDAQASMLPTSVPTSFQVVVGNSKNFVMVLEDGEVVNFTDTPSPYGFRIPELAGQHHFTIYRRVTDFTDLFFVLEDQNRGLYYAFYAGVVYRMSKSVKEAVLNGQTLRPKMNDDQTDWGALAENGRVYSQLTRISAGTRLVSLPLDARQMARWNRRLVKPPTGVVAAVAHNPDPVLFRLSGGRYSILRGDNGLEITDRDTNGEVVSTIPLLASDFALSETAGSLLIHYFSEHRTDAFEIGSFDHRGAISFCTEELLRWKRLKSPRAWNPKAPKI